MVTMKKSVTMEAVKSLLLEWDGDGSGLEAVETAGGTLYKAADVIVQNEDIPGMTVTDNEGKETLVTDSIYNDMISRSLVGDGFSAKVAGLVWIAQKEAQAPGAKLPAGGIWLLKKQDGSYPKKVVLPAYREAFLQGEKPNGEQGESMGGGVTSWNDLTDNPFGDNRKFEEVKIEWDGNTDELVALSNYRFKVSDRVPTAAELKTGTMIVSVDGSDAIVDLGEDNVAYDILGGYSIGSVPGVEGKHAIYVQTSEGDGLETGIYFYNNAMSTPDTTIITKSLTYTATTGKVDTIDYQLMPPGYPRSNRQENTLFEGALNGGQYEASGDVITLVEGVTYSVTTDSGVYDAVCKKTTAEGTEFLYLGNAAAVGVEDTGENFVVLTIPGMLFMVMDLAYGGHIAIAELHEDITPMAAKFLPDPSALSAEWIAALKTALGI